VRDADGSGAETVSLDGSRSVSENGRITGCTWYKGVHKLADGVTARVDLPVGTHRVTLEARAGRGPAGYDDLTVTVLPRTDPDVPQKQLAMWLKADAITGLADGAALGKWVDSSGNDLDPFQKDASKRPVWKANAVNGRPAVRFDGSDDLLRTDHYRGLLFSFHQASVFAVFRTSGAPATASIVSHDWPSFGTSSQGALAYTTAYDKNGRTRWEGISSRSSAVAADRWTVGAMVRRGSRAGETRLYVNGRQNDTGAAIGYHNINSDFGLIGCGRSMRGLWKGDIAEIIIYGRALSDKEKGAVEAYLGRKYGISVSASR
jgi:hypothetical protein